jgi:putative CocE/NonD family hydrolase
VHLFVVGANEWRDFEQWPPQEAQEMSLHLQPDGALADRPAAEPGCATYHYDPANPTPSLGGPALAKVPFTVDNRALEARRDVLCFTTTALEQDLDVIGVPAVVLHVASSAPSADFFARMCDVDETGVSRNVCDGLQRIALTPGGNPERIRIELWPTAFRFRRGHRLRLQVSSGAFPRWARNLGTGEPFSTGTEMRTADQSIHFGGTHPSVLRLPVCPPP